MPNASKRRRLLGPLLVLLLAAAVLVYPMLGLSGFLLSSGVLILNYALMATGWNFVGGFTGYISLGHAPTGGWAPTARRC